MLLVSTCVVFSQKDLSSKSKKAVEHYKNAQHFYISSQFDDAIDELDNAILRDKKFKEAYLLKADIYHSKKDYENEFSAISTAVGLDSVFHVPSYFNAGIALFNCGRYDDAIMWFKQFKHYGAKKRTRLNPDIWIEKSQFARDAVNRPVPFNPVNLGSGINSIYDEYWPSLTADEENMVFTVLLPRDTVLYKTNKELPITSKYFNEDFFISSRVNGVWQHRQNMVSINTETNEGAQTLSADGRWMFFTACGRNDSYGGCDIYFSQKTASGWSKPVNIGAPVNTPFWESQPCFSADGKTLYFVSNRSGGIGKKDIWKSSVVGLKSDGTPIFGEVENLGNAVNTEEDEASPFLHPDNMTLYFSSEGWPGFGRMDIFVGKRNKETGRWQEPENIGYPINTSSDEIGLVVNTAGTRAYFSSDGISDKTFRKDIFSFELPQNMRPKPVSYVKGRVFDKKTGLPLVSQVVLTRLADGEIEATTQSVEWSGQYLVCLPAGTNYALNVRKKGYMFHSENFSLKDVNTISDPYMIDVYLSPLVAGERVVLRNVFYATNSAVLERESIIELDLLVEILNENPGIRLEIGGHTDNTGTEAYNLKLSRDRAQSVYDFLIFRGIDRERLTYKGYGMSEPVESNDTEEGRAQNRRTEVKILDDIIE
jgi:outer membrane protein OmpA-like peptidoglycan-associated protein